MKYKKGTFVVIPNTDRLKGKPSLFLSIYFWLCYHADEEGVCFPTRKTIAECAGVDIKTVDKYTAMLEEEGLIKKTHRQKKNSKENTSNLYQITLPSESETPTGGLSNGAGTIPIINYTNLSTSPEGETQEIPPFKEKVLPLEFSYEKELKKLSESKWKPDKIIALFWMRKKWKFENAKQFKSERGRQLKPAQALEGYNSQQIEKAFEYCEDNYNNFPWGLETCLKVISKVINE